MCGSGGCTTLIIQGTSSGYGSILLDYVSLHGWVVGTDTNNGCKNIYKADKCRPNNVREACYTVSQFDGREYGLSRVVSKTTLRGQVVLASSEYHPL